LDIVGFAASCYAERKENRRRFYCEEWIWMRIIIVEDQNLVLDSLVNLLNGEPDFEVVNALTDADTVDAACERLCPDVVLMDVCTENGSSGLKAAARLRREFPNIKVIIMTGFPTCPLSTRQRKPAFSALSIKI
jgi:chemotaxis response regulator CheB